MSLNLLEKVRVHILTLQQAGTYTFVRKEELAKFYGAKEHEVQEVLATLNREGLVSQARHVRCWDRGIKYNKCWHPDYYVIRQKRGEG